MQVRRPVAVAGRRTDRRDPLPGAHRLTGLQLRQDLRPEMAIQGEERLAIGVLVP